MFEDARRGVIPAISMKCLECGFDNADDRAECSSCGAALSDAPAGAASADDATTPATIGPEDATLGFDDPLSGPRPSPAPASQAYSWSDSGSLSADGHVAFDVGSVLAGRYEIVALLGQGGMGAVYRAIDRELDQPVAVKLVRPELAAHPEILSRFKQELILAREVTHPNVVRIFEFGMDRGVRFITMEYVEGRDLRSLMKDRQGFSPEEFTEIACQVCRALKAAHDAGVVHRDLKPQNIMVDDKGQAKVMDFGVARSADTSGLTMTGQLIGTPRYMSPEQAKGKPADQRSDIFSLGIIFYAMLTDEIPFLADTTVGTLVKRTTETAPPPVKKKPEIPLELNDVVVKCLQIEPDMRYQNVGELLEDLETGQAPRRASALTRLRYKLRSSRPSTRWAALSIVVLLVALGALALRDRSAPQTTPAAAGQIDPVSLAILPFHNATGDPQVDWLRSSLAEMLRSDIGQSAQLRTVPSDRVHQILSDLKLDGGTRVGDAVVRRLAEHSNAEMILEGQYTRVGERIRVDATLHDLERQRTTPIKAEAATEDELLAMIGQLAEDIRANMDLSADALREIEAASFVPSSESIEALRFYNEALQLERQGNYLEALQAAKSSVDADPRFALAHAKLGQLYVELGRDVEGEQASRDAVELSAELPEYERHLIAAGHATVLNDYEQAIAAYGRLTQVRPDDPELNFRLADLYEQTGDFDAARERLLAVLEVDPNYVDALYALGRVEIRSGNAQRSLDPLNRALTLTVQADNQDGRGRVLNAIGIAYKRLGKPEEALRHYRDSLQIRRDLDQKSGIAASLAEIASVQRTLGNLDEARASLEEALQIGRDIGDRGGVADSLIELGNFHDDLGEHDVALRYYKDSLQIWRELGDDYSEALCLNNIGVVYLNRGEPGDALTYFEQALRVREEIAIAYDVGETLHNLAEATASLGRYDRALDYYLEALEQMRLAEEQVGVAAALHGVGVLFANQGRFRAALDSHREAQEALEASGEEGYWEVIVTSRLGSSLSAAGRFDEGNALLEQAAAAAEELENPALVAQVLNFLGENRLYRGELPQAASLFDRALEQATAADDPRAILASRLNQARLALDEGSVSGMVGRLESVAEEAERRSLKHLAAESSLLLAEALFREGRTEEAQRILSGLQTELERYELRPLMAMSRHLLARMAASTGDTGLAAEQRDRLARILEEIRQEAGEENPFLRRDLQRLESATADGV